jgi:glycosyltransferase involved in cell wall biosynthesis
VSYNAVLTIEQTILSVINQTYPHIEYIIIDGGSTDGTVDIIKKYANRIAYWVSEPDKGIYDAMNKGIRTAKGEWINFMNAGDLFYSKDTLEKFTEKAPIGFFIFLAGAMMVYVLIIACVLYRAWAVSNSNPVDSLKSE